MGDPNQSDEFYLNEQADADRISVKLAGLLNSKGNQIVQGELGIAPAFPAFPTSMQVMRYSLIHPADGWVVVV